MPTETATPIRALTVLPAVREDIELHTADGGHIPLTTAEVALLEVFVRNVNRVLSRDRLLERTPEGRAAAAGNSGDEVERHVVEARVAECGRRREQNADHGLAPYSAGCGSGSAPPRRRHSCSRSPSARHTT